MMKSLHGPEGDYLIERGIINGAGELIKALLMPRKALIVSDENVFKLYGVSLIESLKRVDIEAQSIVIPPGEQSKNTDSFLRILYKLSNENFSRSDVLIALGGGVTGDLGGFAASCFKRGMSLVQMPASLLAMVDSSVGGKTGIDFNGAKNQIGSFYEPNLTICDPDFLKTLPPREYKCGAAEIIKTAVLFDEGLFESIMERDIAEQAESVIESCVKMKLETVAKDLHDKGRRQLLNFGHSIGHAAEALSGYEIAHGEAVAMGMAAITKASVKMDICGEDTLNKLMLMLAKYGLPDEISFSAEEIYDAMLSDKKFSGRSINLIVPQRIGKCRLMQLSLTELKKWLYAGGLKW